jgi:hypothetical protein
MSIAGIILNRMGMVKLKPAVFLHIPKTAGTSIVRLARRHYGRANWCSHGATIGRESEEFKKKRFVSGHFGYDFARPLMLNRYSFTFLRDPVDRILSFYYFCKTRDPNEFPAYKLVHENSLDRYLELAIESKQIPVWNFQARLLAYSWEYLPEYTEDELVDMAIRHLGEFSHVGFTETFDHDVEKIVSGLGIVGVKRLNKSNVTRDRAIYGELPSNIKKLLERASELDRRVYDYAWAHRHVSE